MRQTKHAEKFIWGGGNLTSEFNWRNHVGNEKRIDGTAKVTKWHAPDPAKFVAINADEILLAGDDGVESTNADYTIRKLLIYDTVSTKNRLLVYWGNVSIHANGNTKVPHTVQ